MQQHFQHELAAQIAEQEQQRSAQDPFERGSTSPSVAPAAEQQRCEDRPAGKREHILVRERDGLAEQLLGEEDAARERQREQHESGRDEAKQVPLERQQRRRLVATRSQAAMQLFFDSGEDQRLKRRDDEQGV